MCVFLKKHVNTYTIVTTYSIVLVVWVPGGGYSTYGGELISSAHHACIYLGHARAHDKVGRSIVVM